MGPICQCEGCQHTRLGRAQNCYKVDQEIALKNPWTLSWGIMRRGNEMSKDQGRDSTHASLEDCQKEVKRLALHYKSLGYVLWFANAKNTNGQTHFNLHL